jgi:hypothetical protein
MARRTRLVPWILGFGLALSWVTSARADEASQGEPSVAAQRASFEPQVASTEAGGNESQDPDLGISPTSLALGGAASIALATYGAYSSLAERRRSRLNKNCDDLCPSYQVEHYQTAKRTARVSLSVGVLAAASGLWLAYHDPDEVIQIARTKKKPQRGAGVSLKVKPRKGGVWASLVARF